MESANKFFLSYFFGVCQVLGKKLLSLISVRYKQYLISTEANNEA
jgi:hypothetical protein